MFRLSFLLVAIFALGGCAAQMEASRIANSARATLDSLKICMQPIEAKPEYARLYQKLGVVTTSDLNRLPFQSQLDDSERISDADIAVDMNWYAENQSCSTAAIERFLTDVPEAQISYTNSQIEIADIINETIAIKPTYGHINQRLLALKLRQKEEAKQMVRNVRARLAAEQQQETEAVAEAATDVAINVLIALATKQTTLVRSQRTFLAANPRYARQVVKIRVIKCLPVGRTYSCVLT